MAGRRRRPLERRARGGGRYEISRGSVANSLGNFRFAAIANGPPTRRFFPPRITRDGDHQFAVGSNPRTWSPRRWPCKRDPRRRASVIAIPGKHGRSSRSHREARPEYRLVLHGARSFSRADEICVDRIGDRGFPAAIRTERHAHRRGHIITGALRDISVKKVGYSGVMMPVMEDSGLADCGARAPFDGPTSRLFLSVRHRAWTRFRCPATSPYGSARAFSATSPPSP